MTFFETREWPRTGGFFRVALMYAALTGMLGGALLLMHLAVAIQQLGGIGPAVP